MTKAQKMRGEELIELLDQGSNGVKESFEAGNREAALGLLQQSQECAIKLGELIESSEGEDFVTIPMIEEYCEQLYKIYEDIQQNVTVSIEQECKTLKKLLVRIEKSVKRDIPERKEVVFLPYKVSMWDSLESVWKAANEDPGCDTYVVPIPYYDKNPDGSFKEMHYEGSEYPDYVPVTDYRAYDIAAHEPDMIFIHNPYDNFNYATSVFPQYYSKNLKQYTKRLVYIPYFILSEIDRENKEEVEGITDFCIAPGVINSDIVIVQSENMRQVYIDVLTKAAGENTRIYWEKKILGLGSPKVDKVLYSKEEDFVIPKEWEKILQKPDGSRKKVILYNTSVNALLRYKEQMLEKMKAVFGTFKKNLEDVALLWRPHPLIKATIESMYPQLWTEYERMVEKYREEGWGIYDDSVELNRALVLSDAYYGDGSSLVPLCQEVGKPVMIQNVEMLD